mmetsp:Transcript_17009/g.28745  ORF Transcript_17009/g.28745 Transcript_17009/m.28745 type:complete len:89 (+) Transcript_17009:2-268(+)
MSKTTNHSSTKLSQTEASTSCEEVVPKEYVLKRGDPRFTFKNFYIEYGRFHQDKTNIWIHLVFIPLIVSSILGLGWMSSVRNLRIECS